MLTRKSKVDIIVELMAKELEQSKPALPEQNDFVPFKLPGIITPFNVGDVISIYSINERNRQRAQGKPQDKK